MRPTHLNFRSPKERTEFTEDVIVTKEGKPLFNGSKTRKNIFSKSGE
jgi:hypothetical protein